MAISPQIFSVPHSQMGQSGILQPKAEHIFRVIFKFLNEPNTFPMTQQLMSISMPSIDFIKQEKAVWKDIDVSFRDDVLDEVATVINRQLENQLQALDISTSYSFTMQIQNLDGIGHAVTSMWVLTDCQFAKIDFGKRHYGSVETVTITGLINYRHAQFYHVVN